MVGVAYLKFHRIVKVWRKYKFVKSKRMPLLMTQYCDTTGRDDYADIFTRKNHRTIPIRIYSMASDILWISLFIPRCHRYQNRIYSTESNFEFVGIFIAYMRYRIFNMNQAIHDNILPWLVWGDINTTFILFNQGLPTVISFSKPMFVNKNELTYFWQSYNSCRTLISLQKPRYASLSLA